MTRIINVIDLDRVLYEQPETRSKFKYRTKIIRECKPDGIYKESVAIIIEHMELGFKRVHPYTHFLKGLEDGSINRLKLISDAIVPFLNYLITIEILESEITTQVLNQYLNIYSQGKVRQIVKLRERDRRAQK